MNGIEKIKEIQAQHRDELRECFRVKEIGVFGSYVSYPVSFRFKGIVVLFLLK